MEGEFIIWKRLSCLVCLGFHDNQSIIQDEPEPSVLSLPDCICFCLSPPPPPPAANGNDTKKFKGDVRTSGVPSRVVHVRKLPNDINEAEVIGLGLPFGKVTNLLMLKGKNQVRTRWFSQLGGDQFPGPTWKPSQWLFCHILIQRTVLVLAGIPQRNRSGLRYLHCHSSVQPVQYTVKCLLLPAKYKGLRGTLQCVFLLKLNAYLLCPCRHFWNSAVKSVLRRW